MGKNTKLLGGVGCIVALTSSWFGECRVCGGALPSRWSGVSVCGGQAQHRYRIDSVRRCLGDAWSGAIVSLIGNVLQCVGFFTTPDRQGAAGRVPVH